MSRWGRAWGMIQRCAPDHFVYVNKMINTYHFADVSKMGLPETSDYFVSVNKMVRNNPNRSADEPS